MKLILFRKSIHWMHFDCWPSHRRSGNTVNILWNQKRRIAIFVSKSTTSLFRLKKNVGILYITLWFWKSSNFLRAVLARVVIMKKTPPSFFKTNANCKHPVQHSPEIRLVILAGSFFCPELKKKTTPLEEPPPLNEDRRLRRRSKRISCLVSAFSVKTDINQGNTEHSVGFDRLFCFFNVTAYHYVQ